MKECFEGADGLLAGFKQNSIWIDHSITDFGQGIEFQKAMTKKGAFMLEAPIMGDPAELMKGQMPLGIAGSVDVFVQVGCCGWYS